MFLIGLLGRAAMAAPAIIRGAGTAVNVLAKVGGAVAGGLAIADGVEKLKGYFEGGNDKPSNPSSYDTQPYAPLPRDYDTQPYTPLPRDYGTQPYAPLPRDYGTQPYAPPLQNQGGWGSTISEVGKAVGMAGDIIQNPTLRVVGDGIKTVGSAVDYFSNSNKENESKEINDLRNMSDKDLDNLSNGLAKGTGQIGPNSFFSKVIEEQVRRQRNARNGQQPYESYRGLDRVSSDQSPNAIAQQLAEMRARQDSIWNDQTTQREGASLRMISR